MSPWHGGRRVDMLGGLPVVLGVHHRRLDPVRDQPGRCQPLRPLTVQNFAPKHPPKNQDPAWVRVLRHVELRPGVRSSDALVDRRL